MNDPSTVDSSQLLNELRRRYRFLESTVVSQLASQHADSMIFERLAVDLDNFWEAAERHSTVFAHDELDLLHQNISLMQVQVEQAFHDAFDQEFEGTPHPIALERTGRPGCPRMVIDPEWLTRAIELRSTSAIARYLGISRQTVQTALLDLGLREPQEAPFLRVPITNGVQDGESGEEVPLLPLLPHTGDRASYTYIQINSYTNPVSSISDDEIDYHVLRHRIQFPRAGITMIHGAFRASGINVPRARIADSLARIDPIGREFTKRVIQRCTYKVPGPNALWHHDGQHGLIKYGIVIHGFVDGHSRAIVGMEASNNNRADTVFGVFLRAANKWNVPSRVRGDHGTENLRVAAYMEWYHGEGRGSYIWGRSVHNVRIERIWWDVTIQFGDKWYQLFVVLEVSHGLDTNKAGHKALLHYLFLGNINDDIATFIDVWNSHKISMRGRANQSPLEIFFFDRLVYGVRGDELTTEDLELYGVDWEALGENFTTSHPPLDRTPHNIRPQGVTSWIGRSGPPPNLNSVPLEPPTDISYAFLNGLRAHIGELWDSNEPASLIERWIQGLAYMRNVDPTF